MEPVGDAEEGLSGLGEFRAEERDLLRAAIDNLPEYIYVKDRQSRFILHNLALARHQGGKRPEDINGKPILISSHGISRRNSTIVNNR